MILSFPASRVVHDILFKCKIKKTQFPATIQRFSILLCGRPLKLNEMISAQRLVRRVHQIDNLDLNLSMIKSEKPIIVPSSNRFVRCFYFTSDGSKYKDRDHHGMIMPQSNPEGIPHFEVATTIDHMGTNDAEGLATLSAEAARKLISPNVLARLGRKIADNDATAALERKITFSKVVTSLRTTECSSVAMP